MNKSGNFLVIFLLHIQVVRGQTKANYPASKKLFNNNNNKLYYQIKMLNLIYNIIYYHKRVTFTQKQFRITKKLIELSTTKSFLNIGDKLALKSNQLIKKKNKYIKNGYTCILK